MSRTRRRASGRSSTGDQRLDDAINTLIADADLSTSDDVDLLNEMLVSVLRLARAGVNRGDLKIAATALREIRNSFVTFAPHRATRKVSIFGSARSRPDDVAYHYAVEIGAALAEVGWMVITGGGPGIMTAGVEGAGPERSFAVTIRLPFEPSTGAAIVPQRHLVRFRYFFTRKLTFMKESSAYICMPGGFGTLDETFELLTLLQTGKEPPAPVVLFQPPGEAYWDHWSSFVRRELIDAGMVSPEDLCFVTITSSVDEAVAAVTGFYRTFHSMRYVDGRLIVRTNHQLDDDALAVLNEEFADILLSGRITRCEPTLAEVTDRDELDKPRMSLHFDHRSFARLAMFVRRMGDL